MRAPQPITVNVFVVSPDTRSERRFELHTSVQQLKTRLELFTGIPVPNQRILLLNNEQDIEPVRVLDDDSRPLGYYSIRDWQVLKIIDTNPSTSFTGQLTDTSQVEKFELTEEEYAKRNDTVLAYKQRNKIGRFAEKDEEPQKPVPEVNIPVGARCEVETTEEGFHKRGTVRFVGSTKFGTGDGIWVGIEYDEPIGKNDGSVNGERYFDCKPKFGVFVRPDRVRVGDFPVEEINFSDEEM
ncbi:CAP Gly-rich domain-containing protein [Phanerochaete sordida]|uniref:CAP Gly-rich domain-containing protein n=1 Tax=Phanerochaete sordida TaxID=48140 RepID=A0A9P3GTC7_9APHY|nr:CAP Gly-rich domain-containing protein [Phanerochaete sordida]